MSLTSIPIKTYYLNGITNAYGQYIISNAQAYANFIVTANQPNATQYQSEWSSAQGSTSTTLFSGGFVNLTLQSISSSSCGSVCSSTCPCSSGYTCTNGMCVQNSKSNTILFHFIILWSCFSIPFTWSSKCVILWYNFVSNPVWYSMSLTSIPKKTIRYESVVGIVIISWTSWQQ